jgi:hypothetical protein
MHAGRQQLGFGLVACLCAVLIATDVSATDNSQQGSVELALPRAAAGNEAVWLRVSLGALPPGARLRISTKDGTPLGTAAPFGARQAQQPATYTIPLPKTAIVDGRVRLRLEVDEHGAPARAPRPGEVEDVVLIYVPVTN